MPTLAELNELPPGPVVEELLKVCGSRTFAERLCARRPYSSVMNVVAASQEVWFNEVGVPGWLEAFAAHPRIGDVGSLKKKFASTAEWCEGEQGAAMASANDAVIQDLAAWNTKYEEKFGHVFLICATGRAAAEILSELRARFPNAPHAELMVAAREQQKITELRLEKLLAQAPVPAARPVETSAESAERRTSVIEAHVVPSPTSGATPQKRSPITTHILDISRGKPAAGVSCTLELQDANKSWKQLGAGATNADGRIPDLLSPGHPLQPGLYRLSFAAHLYLGQEAFYPEISIAFQVRPHQLQEHFHVPILLSPFGFSTYRGS